MARATLGPGSLAGSRLTFNAPRPSMAGARGPEPRKRVNQRMDDLRKQQEIASTDVLFYHTLSGFQHWKPAKRHKKDLPKCMMPLEGPVTVYINRRGVAPSFQRDMGPIKAPHRTEKPRAAQGLPPVTSKVPYFGDYGGAPWLEQGKPHGALGYPKDERKKTKCRKIMGDFCSCYPQQGGGVLQPPPPDKDGHAGPYLQQGSRPEDVEEEKDARRRRDKSIKGRSFAGDVEDEQGADYRSEVEDGDADGRRPYDRAKAEYRTEKDLDNVEKSWGIMEQILQKENEKRKEAEEAARQQALYEAMWDEFDDVIETSDEEQTHICLQKTKCIPRRCKIWRVGSKIKTSSSEEEPDQEQANEGPERPSKRGADTGLHPHFTSEVDHGSGSQRGSTQPQTEGRSMIQQGNTNGEYRAGSIRRSTGQDGYAAPFGPRQEEYPAPFGTRQEGYPAPFGTRQEGYPAPFGTRQEGYPTAFDTRQESSPASKYYVPCLAGQDFKSSKEQRKSAVSGGVCYSRHTQRRRSAKCKQKKLCESATSIKRHHKQKEKVKREKAPCSRKKYKKCSRRRTADPPSSCGHPRCNFSSRLTYPVELLPYSASHRHAACNPEHRGFQQPTVSCPIKWRDINIGQL